MRNKILFVQELFCDKNPNWQTNSIHNVFNSFIASCPQYIFHRIHYDESSLIYNIHIDSILPKYCVENNIEIVVVTPLGGPDIMGDTCNVSIECLKKLKSMGIYIAYQWPDFGNSFGGETAKYLDSLSLVDLHIIWDNGWSDYHLRYPYTDKHLKLWVPQDNNMFRPYEGEKDIPVSFLGSARYGDRAYFVNQLIKNIPEFIIRGGQREEGLGPYEYANFIRRSKISINFSLSPAGFFQTKGRVFEVTACDSLLLEYRNPATASLYTPGEDYIEFSNDSELIDRVKFFLNNESERKRISSNGHKKYLDHYKSSLFWDKVISKIKNDLDKR